PEIKWLEVLQKKCHHSGALLIVDEIQTGFGRTGTLWAFEQFNLLPDILLLGKALGGGMPLGAFIASKKLMDHLMDKPVLGHITTFGGHPVCCAAGLAAFEVLNSEIHLNDVKNKEKLFRELLIHDKIKAVRSAGLLIAVEFESFEVCKNIIDKCILAGVVTDWFLFAGNCMRIAPPLIITEEQISRACDIIVRQCGNG